MKMLVNVCLMTFGLCFASSAALAQEPSLPPVLEIGGYVTDFDPKTSTLVIDGKSFQITTDTPIWVEGQDGYARAPLSELNIPKGSRVFYEPLPNNRLRGVSIIPPSTKSAR
ncbi:MAG: hypothetical protein AB7S56_04660 [Halothiobacillaceae bacterium]